MAVGQSADSGGAPTLLQRCALAKDAPRSKSGQHRTSFSDLCSVIKTLTGLGFSAALVRVVFVVVDDAVHHGRSPADRRHDHVAVLAVKLTSAAAAASAHSPMAALRSQTADRSRGSTASIGQRGRA